MMSMRNIHILPLVLLLIQGSAAYEIYKEKSNDKLFGSNTNPAIREAEPTVKASDDAGFFLPYKDLPAFPSTYRAYTEYNSPKKYYAEDITEYYKKPVEDTKQYYKEHKIERTEYYKEPAEETTEYYKEPTEETTEYYKEPAEETTEYYREPAEETTEYYKEPAEETTEYYKEPAEETSEYYKLPLEKTTENYKPKSIEESKESTNDISKEIVKIDDALEEIDEAIKKSDFTNSREENSGFYFMK